MSWFTARALGMCIVSLAWPAHAAAPALTLAEAVARTLERNPALAGSAFALKAADAHVEQAGFGPRPELRLDLENFAGSGTASGADALESTLTLSQVLELGGLRSSRAAVAQAQRDVIVSERDVKTLDALAEVTRRFVEVAADGRRLALATSNRDLAAAAVKAADKRVRAAKSPEAELLRARVAETRAGIEEEHAEHELAAARRKLAASWGATEPDFEATQADLLKLPTPASFETIVAGLERNPAFARLASEERLRDAELRLAASRRAGSVNVGVGVRRREAPDDQAIVASVSVPLFSARAAEPAVAAATAQRAVTQAQRKDAQVRVQAELFEIYQELRHAITEATALRDAVVPQMQEALRQTNYAYERGRYGYVELADAQRELIAARRRLIDMSADAHLFAAELERLTAAPVALPAPQ